MASDLVAKAKDAFFEDHFKLAVDLYSQAILIDPDNSKFFSDRAQAYIKLKNFTEAVADAEKAIELDSLNSKAYLRKGTACFILEKYQTARTAFTYGSRLTPEDTRFTNGIKMCDKFRHRFSQMAREIVVTIFAEGVTSDSVSLTVKEQMFRFTIDIPGEELYIFEAHLFGKILTRKCSYEVLSTKVIIKLPKADNVLWTCFGFDKNNLVIALRCKLPSEWDPWRVPDDEYDL